MDKLFRKKTISERGKFKELIHAALYTNEKLRNYIIGDTTGLSPVEIQEEFSDHVKSHLFFEDTITEAGVYIYYDVVFPDLHSNIKDCRLLMYVICHRDIIDKDRDLEGYHGNRIDILSEMIEETLLDRDVIFKYGIGELRLDSVSIYNAARFYGSILDYSVPDFR